MSATLHPSSFILPPSQRDFEIHRLSSIELLSTRKIAGEFKISQTRVRQIVEEVSYWLAEKLPFATDSDLERGKRLALHLAAAQLRHQLEVLQELWSDTKDTKYARQQTRCILALARLGIIPGTLEALSADAESSRHTPCAVPERTDAATDPPTAAVHSAIRTPHSALANPQSQIPNPKSDFPPDRDCSPKPAPHSTAATAPPPSPAPTPLPPTSSDEDFIPDDANLDDLNDIEQHLLTLLDHTPRDKPKTRDALNQSLTELRQKRACLVLKLSPTAPTVLTIPSDSSPNATSDLPSKA